MTGVTETNGDATELNFMQMSRDVIQWLPMTQQCECEYLKKKKAKYYRIVLQDMFKQV